MTGYNPLLARIGTERLPLLAAWFTQAYPDRPLPLTRTGELARDWILRGLLEYAETSPVARQWLAMQAKGT